MNHENRGRPVISKDHNDILLPTQGIDHRLLVLRYVSIYGCLPPVMAYKAQASTHHGKSQACPHTVLVDLVLPSGLLSQDRNL